MQRLVVVTLVILGICFGQNSNIQWGSFDSTALSNIQLNGAARNYNPNGQNILILTPSAGGQVGSAFYETSITLANDASFSTAFQFSMTNPGGGADEDGYGADGIVFIINSLTNIVGASGGGIGYQGLGKSVGIEFDSWDNGYPTDINGNHIGIDINGNIQSAQSVAYATRFNNGGSHYAWVDFDGASKTLEVRCSETNTRPANALMSRNVDILSILQSTVAYVGFSAGTGGAQEQHNIHAWTFTPSYAPIQVPGNPPAPPASVCGNGVIEASEQCDGGACCSTTCTFSSSTSTCRTSNGACDVAETCTGSSSTCPADGFASSSQVCRASADTCDVAETCTGSSASCPADSFASSSVVCRNAFGSCDVAESCTGSSASCPADGFASSSVVCRASVDTCDVAESCTGSSSSCPADGVASSSVVCRPAVNSCDIPESCTGSATSCPADKLNMNATCFCARQGVSPKPYPDYFCAADGHNQAQFYQCVYGVYAPQSHLMTCAPGLVCGCDSVATECGCSGTRSPCVFAYSAPISATC